MLEALYFLMLLKRRYVDLPGSLASSTFLQGFAERQNRSHHSSVRDNFMVRGEMLYMLNRIDEAREMMLRVITGPAHEEQPTSNIFIANAYLALCDAADAAHPAEALQHIDAVEDAARWAHILELDFSTTHGRAAWPRILRDYR